ncbi:MAG TPA: hypothetical protein VFX16_21095 [Pseudonocardiaceae bacterium]|nr:hypothetical protein [Pseudonocardiaceae bacterium]
MPIDTIRAKFRCTEETRYSYNPQARTLKFQAVSDDGVPEHQRFAKATPSGSLQINVDNPAVQFEVGAHYYLDFTKVDS